MRYLTRNYVNNILLFVNATFNVTSSLHRTLLSIAARGVQEMIRINVNATLNKCKRAR